MCGIEYRANVLHDVLHKCETLNHGWSQANCHKPQTSKEKSNHVKSHHLGGQFQSLKRKSIARPEITYAVIEGFLGVYGIISEFWQKKKKPLAVFI